MYDSVLLTVSTIVEIGILGLMIKEGRKVVASVDQIRASTTTDYGHSNDLHVGERVFVQEPEPAFAESPLLTSFKRSKAVRQRMLGLVKHDVVRAGYGHHNHESVPVILNFAAELRSFVLQFSDRV
jgi:hypothetical protein